MTGRPPEQYEKDLMRIVQESTQGGKTLRPPSPELASATKAAETRIEIPPRSVYFDEVPGSTISNNGVSPIRIINTGEFASIAGNTSFFGWGVVPVPSPEQQLQQAANTIKELEDVLNKIKQEPLILQRVQRVSKCKKHAFIKKGEFELRIQAPDKLLSGDEVLLHPKTFQIVEHLGRPPLEVSRFAPDTIPNVRWADIGGLEEAKADLIEAIEMPHRHKELFQFYGKKPIKGILLAGPPGCGKTMLGKAAATALANIYGKEKSRTGFLYVKGPEILNQYVGNSEQTIRDLFFDALCHKEEHGYPAVIFLDEADALLATRGTRNVGIGNTIVPMFLTEMDGLQESGAIVIIATNRPDVLDPAIVRDGRIDRKVTVSRPDIKNAAEILRLNLINVPLNTEELNSSEVAQNIAEIIFSDNTKTQGGALLRDIVSGAMLANCVQLAISNTVKRKIKSPESVDGVTFEDLQSAITRIQKQSSEVQHDLERAPELMAVAIMGTPPQQSEEKVVPIAKSTNKMH